MAFKITAKRYVQICKKTLARKTKYRNQFPYNCGYYDGTYLYGDCWNFNPKSIIWGEAAGTPVCDNYTIGTCVDIITGTKKSGLPDTTGDYIMSYYCTPVSFSKMLQDKKAPCMLLISGQHMGAYIGEWTQGSKTYNTCEYTSNPALGDGLCPSYVDQNGARRICKGGQILGYWNKAGYLTAFVDYSDSQTASTQSTPIVHLDAEALADAILTGYVNKVKVGNGNSRITTLKSLGYTEAEIKAAQNIINKKLSNNTTNNNNNNNNNKLIDIHNNIAKTMPIIKYGSNGEAVKVLQKVLKALGLYTDSIDSNAGPNTIAAIKALQKQWGITTSGIFNENCWKKLLEG